MSKATLIKKVAGLEVQVRNVMRQLRQKPRLDTDADIWRDVKGEVKKTRKKLFKKLYA